MQATSRSVSGSTRDDAERMSNPTSCRYRVSDVVPNPTPVMGDLFEKLSSLLTYKFADWP